MPYANTFTVTRTRVEEHGTLGKIEIRVINDTTGVGAVAYRSVLTPWLDSAYQEFLEMKVGSSHFE